MGAVLRPRSGARALGAGPRKQVRRLAKEPLPSDYPRLHPREGGVAE